MDFGVKPQVDFNQNPLVKKENLVQKIIRRSFTNFDFDFTFLFSI